MRKIILALAMLVLGASFAVADTIYLKDGRTIQGTVLGFVNGRFVVRVEPRYATQTGANTDSNISRTLFTQPSSELSGWMLPVSLYFQCAA